MWQQHIFVTHLFKNMVIFNVDLDNTLIYSYKHDIGTQKRCAEVYEGREISFMTHRTQELLSEVEQKLLVVPTTTRTKEQYERIALGLKEIPYALVCNGGVLLRNGIEDEAWYLKSLEMVSDCQEELKKAEVFMEEDEDRCFEVRNIKDLFVFTKSNKPDDSIKRLSEKLDTTLVDVFKTGIKVYVVPKNLSKADGVRRLKEELKGEKIIAAGDSEFDVPMLKYADVGLAPWKLELGDNTEHVVKMEEDRLFSESMLEYVLQTLV